MENIVLPDGWKITSLQDVSTRIIDIDHKMPKKTRDGIPFLSIGYLVKDDFPFLNLEQEDSDLEFISEIDYKYYSKRFSAERNDLLYTRFGTVGISKLVNTNDKLIASYSVVLIKPNHNIVFPLYLTYVLNSYYTRKQAKVMTQGSSNQNFHLSDIKILKILLPSSKLEQKKISHVLFAVDELIQKTDQIIKQIRRLKRGLMQKLLTKGIEHKEFKRSQIGIMPAQWNVMQLKEVCTKIIDMDHKMPMKTEKGIAFVSVGYLNKSSTIHFDIGKADRELEHISNKDYLSYSKRFNAERNDLLISRYGTIGVVKLINTDQKFLASYSIALIKPNRNAIIPLFLAYFLNSSVVKKQILYMTQISSNTNLGVLDINRIIIFVPTLPEQIKISSVLSNIDLYIHQQYNHKRKLDELKKGLMQYLLTGKIRVKL